MALHIKADGTRTILQPGNNRRDFNLEELQAAVGGYIEYLYLTDDYYMCVNEEGRIHDLPLNQGASIIAAEYYGQGSEIFGDVLIVRNAKDGKTYDTDFLTE